MWKVKISFLPPKFPLTLLEVTTLNSLLSILSECVCVCLVFVQYLSAITKYHRLSALNNRHLRHLFTTVLEAEKYKIKVPVILVPGGNSLPGL